MVNQLIVLDFIISDIRHSIYFKTYEFRRYSIANFRFQPATSVERRQKFIEKIKLNCKYDDFKKKRAELEKLRRQRLKYSLAKLPERKRNKLVAEDRLKSRERVKKCREKKREAELHAGVAQDIEPSKSISSASIKPEALKLSSGTSVRFQNSYRTEGALVKAASKVRKMIPSSPSKKKAVIAKLFYSLNDDDQKEIIQNKTSLNKGGAKGIDSTLKQQILEFYEKDDVSRMSPNVKDTKYFRNPTTGEKELKQKRHMIVTLQEAYDAFKEDNSGEVFFVKCVKLFVCSSVLRFLCEAKVYTSNEHKYNTIILLEFI